jgi:hypothetical protein
VDAKDRQNLWKAEVEKIEADEMEGGKERDGEGCVSFRV